MTEIPSAIDSIESVGKFGGDFFVVDRMRGVPLYKPGDPHRELKTRARRCATVWADAGLGPGTLTNRGRWLSWHPPPLALPRLVG